MCCATSSCVVLYVLCQIVLSCVVVLCCVVRAVSNCVVVLLCCVVLCCVESYCIVLGCVMVLCCVVLHSLCVMFTSDIFESQRLFAL